MLWSVKTSVVNRPLVMWGNLVGGREGFSRPIVRSQSFSELITLDCELHKNASHFSHLPL